MSPETPPPPSADTGGRKNRKGGRPGRDTPKGSPSDEQIAELIIPLIKGGYRFEYRIRYCRQGWERASTKVFQYEAAARNYSGKLLKSDPKYAPLTLLVIERRPVGPWGYFFTLVDAETGEDVRKERRP